MDQRIELVAPGGIENLRLADHRPEDPKAGELRIRHDGIGVNFIDIYQRIGLYPLPLPAVIGVEGAGTVEAIGAGVTGFNLGDRIAYAGLAGAYASTRLLPAWRAIKLPEDIGTKTAAGAFLRGLTVHMLLSRTYRAEKGSTLLIHAAAGGLGATLTRWAKHLGCRVIGTVGSDEKARIALANGADHAIIGRDADILAEVASLTKGQGVDFAIDGIGGDRLRKTLGCVRRFGVVASVGQAAGPITALAVEELGPARSLVFARPSVIAYAAEQETYSEAACAVIKAIRCGIISAASRDYPLRQAARAHEDLESGRTTGRILLLP